MSLGLLYEKGRGEKLTGWSNYDYAGDLNDKKVPLNMCSCLDQGPYHSHQRNNQLSHFLPQRLNSLRWYQVFGMCNL